MLEQFKNILVESVKSKMYFYAIAERLQFTVNLLKDNLSGILKIVVNISNILL